jgi:hypothetical protein
VTDSVVDLIKLGFSRFPTDIDGVPDKTTRQPMEMKLPAAIRTRKGSKAFEILSQATREHEDTVQSFSLQLISKPSELHLRE